MRKKQEWRLDAQGKVNYLYTSNKFSEDRRWRLIHLKQSLNAQKVWGHGHTWMFLSRFSDTSR
jgi:hypothetical protein